MRFPGRLPLLLTLVCGMSITGLAQDKRPSPALPASPAPPTVDVVSAWSLDQLEGLAQEASPDLRQAAAEIGVTRGKRLQAGLYPNPALLTGAQQLGGRESQYIAYLSQEIVTKGKLQLDKAAVHQEVTQAELRFVRTRFDLLTAVRQAFYTGLAAQRRVETLKKLLAIIESIYEESQNVQKTTGLISEGDVLLLEIERDRRQMDLENDQALLAAALLQLAATLGDPDLRIETLKGSLQEPLPNYPYELTRAGLLSNSQLQAAQVEIQRNQLLARRAEVEPFPNVTVQSGYMRQYTGLDHLAVLQVGLPLPLWNRNQGNIQAARSGISKAMETVRKTEVDLSRQLANATGRFQAAQKRVDYLGKSILPKAEKSLAIVQQTRQAGQFDLLRVLQSQRVVVEGQLDLIAAQEIRWTAAAEIAGLIQEEVFPASPAHEELP
jgi:cobalt-zinc-cadmium efflux system outer membrane protein